MRRRHPGNSDASATAKARCSRLGASPEQGGAPLRFAGIGPQLGGTGKAVVAPARLQGLGNRAGERQNESGNGGDDGIPGEGMAEAKGLAVAIHQLGGDRCVQPLGDIGVIGTQRGGERAPGESLADQGGCDHQTLRGRREALEA
jgi:hypothetical protein